MNGDFWCPRHDIVRLAPCPTPPSKRIIFEEVLLILRAKKLNIGIQSESKVDLNWLLGCLSTLNEQHDFFKRDYHPMNFECVSKRGGKAILASVNAQKFFENLPLKTPSKSRASKRQTINFTSNVNQQWSLGNIQIAQLAQQMQDLHVEQSQANSSSVTTDTLKDEINFDEDSIEAIDGKFQKVNASSKVQCTSRTGQGIAVHIIDEFDE